MDTHNLSMTEMPYHPDKGVSFNLLRLFQAAHLPKKVAQSYMYESLQAMDEELTHNPISELALNGVDGLEAYFQQEKITSFAISDGFIDFKNEENELVLSLPLLSRRQRLLRESFYSGEVIKRRSLAQEILEREKEELRQQHEQERKKAEQEQRAALWRVARETAFKQMGGADDSLAVHVEAPRLAGRPFKMPSSYWIRSETTPLVLSGNPNDKYVCMAHVGELLSRELGEKNLKALGYVEGNDAWELKRTLISKKAAVELAPGLNQYVKVVSKGRVWDLEDVAVGENYRNDISQLWEQLDQATAKGGPVVLPLYNKFSNYKKEVAASNARLTGKRASLRSLNTHVAYCLGKDYRSLTTAPMEHETAQRYLLRALKLPAQAAWVLSKGEIRVNGENVSLDTSLKTGDKVEYGDFWFSHHIYGSQITSLTEFIGSGQFVPTGLLQLNNEALDPSSLPEAPKDHHLTPAQVLYIEPGQALVDLFHSQVSRNPELWEQYKLYLKIVGVDDTRITPTEPLPIPDFISLNAYLNEMGGFEVVKMKYERGRAEQFSKQNPEEQLLLIEAKLGPWKLLEPLFPSLTPITSEERKFILESVDRVNSSIDLRTFQTPSGHREYLKWEAGQFIWMSDELIENLKKTIEYERIQATVHVPPELDLATPDGPKKVPISQEKRDVIERATTDPEMRTYLTLLLLNEQEGGQTRNWATRQLEKASGGAWKEGSVGLFQVVPDPHNWEKIAKEEGYSFPNFDAYREALINDPLFNARVAIRVMQEVRTIYNHFLTVNGEEPSKEDEKYVGVLLTMYNRPSGRVINGLFSYNAQKVSDTFGLGISAEDPAHLGKDQTAISKHWGKIAQALIQKGIISMTAEEISNDQELLQNALEEAASPHSLQDLDPLFHEFPGAYLLTLNKSLFLESQFYKKINSAYERATGEKLSLVLDTDGFENSKIGNYGYRVTRYGQLAEIMNYSYGINLLKLEKQGLQPPIPLEELPSVLKRQQLPVSPSKGNSGETDPSTEEVIPYKVELSPEELAQYPVNKNGLVSILFTGGRSSSDRHGGGTPDAIKQILIDPRTGVTTIVDLPRDLRVNYQGQDGTARNSRLNAVRRFGEEPAFRQAIAEITGQEVVNSVNFDFEAVMENIDKIMEIIGNIEIDNPNGDAYVGRVNGNHYFPPHTVLKNGEEVMNYARFRKGWVVNEAYDPTILDKEGQPLDPDDFETVKRLDGTDTQRSQRQTLLMQAIMNNVFDHWAEILPLLPELMSTIETDVALTQIPSYTLVADKVKASRKVISVGASGKIKPQYSGLDQRKYQGEALHEKNAFVRAVNNSFEGLGEGA